MTDIFIDCEFNGFNGSLISIALVSEDGHEFYETLACKNPTPWVADQVLPILNKEPVSLVALQKQLHKYLLQFESINVIADWPEDIKHFCELLIIEAGTMLKTPPISMQLVEVEIFSLLPHNALEDARALMKSYLNVFTHS